MEQAHRDGNVRLDKPHDDEKGKTNLDFNEERDDGVAVASAGPCANHLHLTPDR